MKQSTLLFLIFLITQITYGQKSSLEGVFAFVYNPLTALPDNGSSISDKVVQKVFDDLVEAKGVKSILAPKLIISNSESVAAWAQPSKKLIGVELKALNVCRSMGKDSLNAMAGLLAHELIHYYENHNWKNHFVHNYSDLEDEVGIENGKQMEMEADDMGGLLAHMAGYRSLSIMPRLLEEIYKSYNLNAEDNSTYPNLESRIQMAKISQSNLEKLIPVFEVANYLMIINEVELAAMYLEYIVSKSGFVSREIHNNLGVLYAIAAYDRRPRQVLKFVFPFLIDFESRLGKKGLEEESFEALTEKAIQFFEAAKMLDHNYENSSINLAYLHILKEEYFEAEYVLRKLEKDFEHLRGNLHSAYGLLVAYQGEKEKARKIWQEGVDRNENIYRINLGILNESESSPGFSTKPIDIAIDNINLNKLYAEIAQEKVDPTLSIDIDENHSFYTVDLESSEIYIHMDYEKDEQYCFFHIIDKPNNQLPLNIGASEKVLIEYFGEPDMSFKSSGGHIYNYKNLNMIAVVQDGKILKWCIYKQSL